MATFTKTGRRFIVQFQLSKRARRQSISLKRLSERQARTVKAHIEHLISAKVSNTAVPADTALWLRSVGDDLHRKLSRVGIVPPRAETDATRLSVYFDSFIKNRSDLKPNTVENLTQVRTFAVEHFGEKRQLASITRGEVKDWHRALLAKYAQATTAGHVKKMRQLYADAIDRGIISDNPFKAVKAGSMSNADRMRYITAAEIEKVIDACPDKEWRLLFALARYAGLRVPSETQTLRWEDIDWQGKRFTVRSPKTERHEGKSKRVLPIFPSLHRYLADAWEPAGLLMPSLSPINPRRLALKIVKRAGLEPWPKLFQNLRSSCETDLASRLPLHVACAWIGNSTGVAIAHYLQVTDEHYRSAALDVAVSTGIDRTLGEPDSRIPQDLTGELQNPIPPRGGHPEGFAGEKLQEAHKAVQAALHERKSFLFHERKRLIDNLASAVAAAPGERGRT